METPLVYGAIALTALLALALALPLAGLRTGMPSIKVVTTQDSARIGYTLIQDAFGKGAPGTLQVVAPTDQAAATVTVLSKDPGVAQVVPAMPGTGNHVLIQVVPSADPSAAEMGTTIDQLRTEVPHGVVIGGASAENHDLETMLAAKTPW